MEISPEMFDNYGEVDCKATVSTDEGNSFSVLIRRIGNGEKDYQLVGKFHVPLTMFTLRFGGPTFRVEEVVLKEGSLKEVVATSNLITGNKDTVRKG